jgi:hypothetical protein
MSDKKNPDPKAAALAKNVAAAMSETKKDTPGSMDYMATAATATTPEPSTDEGPMPGPVVERRRVNRGSTRRIVAAANQIDKDLERFIAEMDLQFFEADAKGNRLGTCEFVVGLRHMRSDIAQEVNKMLYPTGKPEAAE